MTVMAMFRHVRWLYNLITVSNAAAVFDAFFFGVPSTRAVSPIAEWLGGFLVTCSWRSAAIAENDERTHSQAGVLIILLHCKGAGPLQGFFSDRFPERIVLEV